MANKKSWRDRATRARVHRGGSISPHRVRLQPSSTERAALTVAAPISRPACTATGQPPSTTALDLVGSHLWKSVVCIPHPGPAASPALLRRCPAPAQAGRSPAPRVTLRGGRPLTPSDFSLMTCMRDGPRSEDWRPSSALPGGFVSACVFVLFRSLLPTDRPRARAVDPTLPPTPPFCFPEFVFWW